MRVVGIDPGVVCTAMVIRHWRDIKDGEKKIFVKPDSIVTKLGEVHPIIRLKNITEYVCKRLHEDDFVVLEAPIVGAYGSTLDLAMLSGFLQLGLLSLVKKPYILVQPKSLLKFATGSGKSKKSMTLKEVYKRWGFDAQNDHEADAFALSQIGLVLAGIVPESELINAQKEVIKTLKSSNFLIE